MNVIAINDQSDNVSTEIDHDVQILEFEALRNSYAGKGDYGNALTYFNKIKELKEEYQRKKKKDLEYNHITEMDNLETLYKQEIEAVTTQWNTKIVDFEEKSQQIEEEMTEKHNKEMSSLYLELESKLDQKEKSSKEYLILAKQEEQLCKLQRFDEAIVVQKKKEAQGQNDMKKWSKETQEKIKNITSQKATKHQNEKEAFHRKYNIELKLLKKQRDDNIVKIDKKYHNKKIELSIQQKNERILSEKQHANKMNRTKKLQTLHTVSSAVCHSKTNTNNLLNCPDEDMTKGIKEQNNEENIESGKRLLFDNNII